MNLPNKLSLLRIFLIPFVIFFYLADFVPYGKIIATIVFILAALTDMLDGKIARKYNLITDLGKLLDPIADKLLVLAALLLVVVDYTIPAPWGIIVAVIIIGRELIISAFRQIAASKNFVMAADKWGKIKTLVTDVALPLLMVYSFLLPKYSGELWCDIFGVVCYVLITLATLLTIISAVNYFVKNKKVLKND